MTSCYTLRGAICLRVGTVGNVLPHIGGKSFASVPHIALRFVSRRGCAQRDF